MSKLAPLTMYRRLLKTAKYYPSINRESIIQEIKDAYRENRDVTDPKKLKLMEEEAEIGLNHMKKYVDIKNDDNIVLHWG